MIVSYIHELLCFCLTVTDSPQFDAGNNHVTLGIGNVSVFLSLDCARYKIL